MAWTRYIRFLDARGHPRHGNALVDSGDALLEASRAGTLAAEELTGSDMFSATRTGRVLSVLQLLGPLSAQDVPIIRAVGLNYVKHSVSCLVDWGGGKCFLPPTSPGTVTDMNSPGNRQGGTSLSVDIHQALSHRNRMGQRCVGTVDRTGGSTRL